MALICEQLPDSLSEVIGSKVLHLYESHPHDKTTKDIFHSLLCVTVQSHPPIPPLQELPPISHSPERSSSGRDQSGDVNLLFYTITKGIKRQMALNFSKERQVKCCFFFVFF